MKQRLQTGGLVPAIGLVAAACGASDDAADGAITTTATVATTTTTPAPVTTTSETMMDSELTLDVTGFAELANGVHYETWAIINAAPVAAGKFNVVDGAIVAPDGVDFPTGLSGGTIVISIEPDPDDGPEPFVLKPLIGQAGDPATDHESYELGNNAVDLPGGIATIG